MNAENASSQNSVVPGHSTMRRAAVVALSLFALLAALIFLSPATPADAAPVAQRAFFAKSTSGDDLAVALQVEAEDLSPIVLARALASARCALAGGVKVDRPLLSVIDYSLPSTTPRMWVFDLNARKLLYREIVAHGVGSGDNYARVFSNTTDSRQTSLGLFRTAETYYGKNGYSMRLDGLEKDINHLARPRTIVVHGAPYVSAEFARRVGRLGRSWGCPALRDAVAQKLIDTVKDGTLLFADHPGGDWLKESAYLSCKGGAAKGSAVAAR